MSAKKYRAEYCKEIGYSYFNKYNENDYVIWLEKKLSETQQQVENNCVLPVVVNHVCPNCLSEMHEEKNRVYKCSNCSTEY